MRGLSSETGYQGEPILFGFTQRGKNLKTPFLTTSQPVIRRVFIAYDKEVKDRFLVL